jgi:hypothetical protein
MKLELYKEKKDLISIAMLGASAFMAVLIIYTVMDFFAVSARAENVVKTALEQIDTEVEDIEQYFTKDREIAESLTKNNLFTPPAPIEHPVKEVRAIFGNQVLINDKWYSEGQSIPGDAKILSIEPTQVSIEWNGRQKFFSPIDASTQQAPSERETAQAGGTSSEHPEMVVVGSQTEQTSRQTPGQRPGQRPREMPDMDRTRIGFMEMRMRYQNMSEAERERLRNEMRQRFGGDRAFGGRGFGGRRGGQSSNERGEQ